MMAADRLSSASFEHTVQVWWRDLDDGAAPDLGPAEPGSRPVEGTRLHDALRTTVRRRRQAAQAFLREVLGLALARPADAIELETDTRGKPHLAGPDPELHFNLSHSGPVAAVAVCRTAPVGIDIEARGTREEPVPASALAPHELEIIAGLSPTKRAMAALTAWVRKEALLKAAGVGLAVAPERVVVPVAAAASVSPIALPTELGSPRDWSLFHLATKPGFFGAVALPRRHARLACVTCLPIERTGPQVRIPNIPAH